MPDEIAYVDSRLFNIKRSLAEAMEKIHYAPEAEGIRDDEQVRIYQDTRKTAIETARELREIADWIDGKNPTGSRIHRFTRKLPISYFEKD